MNGTERHERPRARHAALTVAAVSSLLALTACMGGDGYGDSTPRATESSSPSATSSTGTTGPTSGSTDGDGSTSPPPFPAAAEPATSDPSAGAALTVSDLRIGHHDGFDRVVFEMGGTGTPGWNVEYVPEAIEDGSGNVVALDGDGTLQVMISGSGLPADTGVAEYSGPNPLSVASTDEVEEVLLVGVFEGLTQAFIGTDDPSDPFRVYALTDPTRVVVEIVDND